MDAALSIYGKQLFIKDFQARLLGFSGRCRKETVLRGVLATNDLE